MITPNKYPSITITVPADIVEAMQLCNLSNSGHECDLNNSSDVQAMADCILEPYIDYLEGNGYAFRKPRQVKVADIEGRVVTVTVEALSYKEATDHVAEVFRQNAQVLCNPNP